MRFHLSDHAVDAKAQQLSIVHGHVGDLTLMGQQRLVHGLEGGKLSLFLSGQGRIVRHAHDQLSGIDHGPGVGENIGAGHADALGLSIAAAGSSLPAAQKVKIALAALQRGAFAGQRVSAELFNALSGGGNHHGVPP